MATVKVKIVEDNTAPPFSLTCKRGSTIIDLTGCTVDLILARGSTIVNTGHQACTVVTPTGGRITYTAQDGDFASPGTYKGDVKITYADLTHEVLYDQLKITARRRLQ